MVCDGQHLCQQTCCPSYVVEIIVKTKSCSGCVTGNAEQGLQVQLTGLLGLTECTTDNLDNDDAHDYGSGSVAHFGWMVGSEAAGYVLLILDIQMIVSSRLTSTKR